MLLKDLCETFEFKIVGGSEYQWECFGPDARFLDFESQYAHGSCVFDSVTQDVYEATITSKDETVRPYRWFNPAHKEQYMLECERKSVDPNNAWDTVNWVDCEVFEDFTVKANAIFNGDSFDSRVQVPLDLSEKELLNLALEAHKRDMTLNQFIELILQETINRHKEQHGATCCAGE